MTSGPQQNSTNTRSQASEELARTSRAGFSFLSLADGGRRPYRYYIRDSLPLLGIRKRLCKNVGCLKNGRDLHKSKVLDVEGCLMLGGHKTEPMPFHDFLPSKPPLFDTVCPPHHFSHRKMRRASKGCCCLSASRMGLAQMGKMRNLEISGCFLVRSWIIIGGQNKGQGSCFIIFQVKRSSAHVFMI